MMEKNTKANLATKTVLTFIEALNKENFEVARTCLRDDVKFVGVLGKREGADVYITDMEKMKLKYQILKVFTDENDVSVFYNIDMQGKKIYSSGWYKVDGNKIQSFDVIFDPRPVLETQSKN